MQYFQIYVNFCHAQSRTKEHKNKRTKEHKGFNNAQCIIHNAQFTMHNQEHKNIRTKEQKNIRDLTMHNA